MLNTYRSNDSTRKGNEWYIAPVRLICYLGEPLVTIGDRRSEIWYLRVAGVRGARIGRLLFQPTNSGCRARFGVLVWGGVGPELNQSMVPVFGLDCHELHGITIRLQLRQNRKFQQPRSRWKCHLSCDRRYPRLHFVFSYVIFYHVNLGDYYM
jgi:hypothetical protein